MTNSVCISDKITCRAARINAGYTQQEAADILGVSVSTLKNWENGKTYPKQPAIEKMCALYKRSYDSINFDV